MQQDNTSNIYVDSEIGTLQRLLVHSPDSGLGKVVPSKAQDWLFEDIVHLENMRRDEYDYYTKILLYFLDPGKIKNKIKIIDARENNRHFYKPGNAEFHRSKKVIEFQFLLGDILQEENIRIKLVASICAIEGCAMEVEEILLQTAPAQLAMTLIAGTLPDGKMIFAPLPNLIFTRDIGIVIKNHILLNKPAKIARTREALLAKYIFYNHPFFKNYRKNIIEISGSEQHFLLPAGEADNKELTLEGGDVMIVSADHILIGCSERTTTYAANQLTKILFEKNIVPKVTIIKIPAKRDYMHIDTIFTQVKRDAWVLLGSLSKQGEEMEKQDIMESLLDTRIIDQLKIMQFIKGKENEPRYFDYLEDLLDNISRNDLKSKNETRFIYSGNNEFPYGDREQWTDSCNVLAIKEGVVIGYDRNSKTAEAFMQAGFSVVGAEELLNKFEEEKIAPQEINNTLILLPSAELSRARGGSHCMSLPLLREATGDR